MGLSLAAALGIGAGSSIIGGLVNRSLNKEAAEEAMNRQVQASKDLLDYQMQKYYSPQALVRQLGAAGTNPAAMFGNTSPVNLGGSMAMPSPPNYTVDVGTQSLSDVASLLVGAAQAKKAGVEIPNIEEDTRSKVLGNERQEFENMLIQKYGIQKSAAELAIAEQNVKLAMAQTDVHVQDKALKEWQTAKEKALSEVNERQRDILQKELDNKDIELDIRNRQGEANIVLTKASANSANASAEASRAQASLSNEQSIMQKLENNIKKATNLYDIDNAIYNADVLQLLTQSTNKEQAWKQLQEAIWNSNFVKNADQAAKVEAALKRLANIIGLSTSVSASAK